MQFAPRFRSSAAFVAEKWPAGIEFTVRIAIHSGEVIARDNDYFGPAVNRAARLRALAAGGAVLLSGTTADLAADDLPDRARLVELGVHQLRDIDRPERVFGIAAEGISAPTVPVELTASLDPDRARASTPRESGHPIGRSEPEPPWNGLANEPVDGPLVGRRTELAHASALLDRISTGGARTVIVAGEPGVGKTRLALAVASEAVARHMGVVYGHCDEGLNAPYQPFVEALGSWVAQHLERLSAALGPSAGTLVHLWPALTSRLSAPTTINVDRETQQWRLFEAVSELVRSISTDHPLLLVFDDLHWADPSTTLMLTHLVRRRLPGTGVLATMRRPDVPTAAWTVLGDLGTAHAIDVMELGGLDPEGVAEFVARHTAGRRPPDELVLRLHQQTDGNPFFLDALLIHLDDVAYLRRDDGEWLTTTELEAVGVPQRVRGVISRRMAGLSTASRRALDVAAVTGQVFEERIVRHVLGITPDDTLDALEEALDAGLVREQEAGRLSFAHALVRQAVLDGLSRSAPRAPALDDR